MPKVSGRKEAVDRIRELSGREQIDRLGKALFASGELLRAEMSFLITQGSVSGANHVPSLPGEPPNEDTGQLRTSITVTQPGPLKVSVSINAPYAGFLEFGTSRMAARPFADPAIKAKRAEIIDLCTQAIRG